MNKYLLTLSLLVGCTQTPPEVVPAALYENGFVIEAPCEEHGTHKYVITNSQLKRFYSIQMDGVDVPQLVDEDEITAFLALLPKTGENE